MSGTKTQTVIDPPANQWTVAAHLISCKFRYVAFCVTLIGLSLLTFRFPDYLPDDFTLGKLALVSDLAQSMLALCALTVPLVLAYIIHPHEPLYTHLALHLENMLGSSGIYMNDINNISTSITGQSKRLEPNAEACIWILRCKYNQARGEQLTKEGQSWLFNRTDLAPQNDMHNDRDKIKVSFYVVVLGFLIVVLFVEMFIGSYENMKFIKPLIISTSATSLVINIAAYIEILRAIAKRLTFKNNCIWKIDSQYESFEKVIRDERDQLETSKSQVVNVAKPPKNHPRVRTL